MPPAVKERPRTLVWPGTERYAVQRRIGEGGMGVVYEAYDRERRQLVALKTLQHFSPTALYRFKQEFRTLADVSHPNLVRLYELVAAGDERIFFAMELVLGTDFLTYARRADAGDADLAMPATARPTFASEAKSAMARREDSITQELPPPDDAPPERAAPSRSRGRSPADFDRLRPALAQLVEGVHALHAAGKLHRDIKPSNVRVTPEGRVVLLDFGVATELGPVVDENLAEREIVGTACYMAPEQSTDDALSAASDWYSVGVMLFQALVGHPPFVGPRMDVLARKSVFDAPPPRDCVDGVPADLDALCCDLLQRAPEARPSGLEILRRIRGRATSAIEAAPRAAPEAAPLVGREAHLAALRDAFEAVKRGRAITVRVHGESGMGKSALVQRFLDDLVARGEAVTLRGRAYERESVPYKAFDSVVDALSRYLRRLSERDVTLALPRDVWALARLFPVLRRVAAIDAAPEPMIYDLQYVRRRAFVALRELLTWLGREQPLVLYIDDLQWGDVDSAGLVLEIVRPPHPPPVLLIATYQSEAHASPFLRELHASWPENAEARDIAVGPLAEEDARRLALTLLAPDDARSRESADAIARESRGSAFLVDELARSVASRARDDESDARAPGVITLERMLDDRLARVPDTARRLLEIVAVAARPLDVETAGASAAVHGGLDDCIALLRTARFVRTGLRDGREVVETIHDRIREVLVAQLPPATLREHHRRLARILEGLPAVDPEALALHFLGAGETQSAARYAERAAEHAVTKLAFEQAARLYELTITIALEMHDAVAPDVRRLRVRRAEALKLAGRGTEAAKAFFEAAPGAPALERIDLEREAAEQLITSGHIDEGIEAMRRVLDAVGMKMPRSPLHALAWVVVYRLWLWLRGWRVREREPNDVKPEVRARIDVYHAVAVGLSLVDAIYGEYMQARHLILAQSKGDRLRLVRALTIETAHLASRGGPETARVHDLAEVARSLAERTREPEARGYVEAMRAFRYFLRGAWKEAQEACDAHMAAIPDDRTGWRNNVHLFAVWSLISMGEVAEVSRRVPALAADALDRGDLYSAVNLRLGFTNLVWLAADDIEGARRQIESGMALWSHRGFYLQHYRALLAEANVDLYAGEGERAYERVTRQWRELERSLLLRVQLVRGEAYFLLARAALASSGRGNQRAARIAEAARCATRLERERMPWTAPLAHLVRAAVAHASDAERNRAETVAHLRAAADRADAANMAMHAAVARYRIAELLGGEEGEPLRAMAEAWMTAQGIRAPARLAFMLTPWT
jgi:serine/threonine protein kinase/ribosome-associated translation inhibitor RaiA